ncbi:MAG: GH25 family lysozyme [Pseudomonadota bacterium]
MTNTPPRTRWRKRARQAAMLLAIVAAIVLSWRWWSTYWRPDPAVWSMQGVAIGADNAPVSWPSLRSQGIGFAYVDATRGNGQSNPNFTRDHDGALSAGLRVGPIHHYRLCVTAMDQVAAFVRLVPRDEAALPPLVMLDLDDTCPHQPTKALLLSDLSTFLTQLETHMGKQAVIAPSAAFEARYYVASAINRPLMIISPRAEPAPGSPAWVLWLANDRLAISGSTGPTRLLVLGNQGVPQ